jgi:hypothetical protein
VASINENALRRTDRTDWKESRSDARGGTEKARCEERNDIKEIWTSAQARRDDAETLKKMWIEEHSLETRPLRCTSRLIEAIKSEIKERRAEFEIIAATLFRQRP